MNKKTKNLLVLIVLIAIIGIAVGYAALSQQLTLNGTASTSTSQDWNVHFVSSSAKVTTHSTTYANTDKDATISLNDNLLAGTFSATLAPGETVVYEVSVINEGSIKASLSDITITGETDHITCTVSPSTQSSTISSNGTHDYTVTLSCSDMETLPTTAETASVTVTFTYNQAGSYSAD
jgi:hypothetical protein